MSYVIKRTDQGGGFLAKPGSEQTYSKFLQDARLFPTFAAAQAEACVGNEIVLSLEDAAGR